MKKVNTRYKPEYHANVPAGWMNDPNGFIYALEKYHLFFQFNPFDVKWGTMHWGHYISEDLLHWQLCPIALFPDEPYDESLGCFSGTAFEENNKLYLIYTGSLKGVKEDIQQQCLAESEDGLKFKKFSRHNPIIKTEEIPEGFSKTDFRDPKLFKGSDGYYYCLIGSKSDKNIGNILLYRSKNLLDWCFIRAILDKPITKDGVLECPDYFELDGQDILFCSPQNLKQNEYQYQNTCSSVYLIGKLDLTNGKFTEYCMDELDAGFDFYAPQTLLSPDGRRIMIAWMNMWDRKYPTKEDGWVGSMTFPRELYIKNGHIYQRPIREIEAYRVNQTIYKNQEIKDKEYICFPKIGGNKIELLIEAAVEDNAVFGMKLFLGAEHETLLLYDASSQIITFDRSKSGKDPSILAEVRKVKLSQKDKAIHIRLFLDKSSVEVFFNYGERTLTSTVFPDISDTKIQFFSISGKTIIQSLIQYEINIS